MVTMDFSQKFTIQLSNVRNDGSPGAIDQPDTLLVVPPGVVTIVDAGDGLNFEVRGIDQVTGTVTITPQGVAGGAPITGNDIQITVGKPPLQPAQTIVEVIGAVVPQ